MPDGREVWATSPCDYIKNAIKTVEGLLAEDGEGYVLSPCDYVKNAIKTVEGLLAEDKEGYVAIEKQGKESIPYELSTQVEYVR
jgi:hypothetical protein